MPTTVHMIANAHLDPVWLWHWQRGADEAIATCRSACDLLDDCPDVVFTRGEAWVYEQVRSVDPALLDRIRAHIASGRWEIVNGWWVQPDCNLPHLDALRRNAETGLQWFRTHLGLDHIPVAYNVDTFGHGAYLPRLLVDLGHRCYIMMRPGPHEKALPSHLFRWHSPDGAAILTYRIPGSYTCARPENLSSAIDRALAAKPDGLEHAMCFYGVGNHGGGPTRALVDWIRAHRQYAPDVVLRFSSPSRYVAAVADVADRCPAVHGELQFHAIGCYTVCGALKRAMRRTELALLDAEALIANAADPAVDKTGTPALEAATAGATEALRDAWRTVAFNQFHDILPGSAVTAAIDTAQDELGYARTLADRLVYPILRQRFGMASRTRSQGHRVHIVNRGRTPWSGLAEFAAWTDFAPWNHHLLDASGNPVPFQVTSPEHLCVDAGLDASPTLLIPVDLAAGEHRILTIVPGTTGESAPPCATLEDRVFTNAVLRVMLDGGGIGGLTDGEGLPVSGPLRLHCRQDHSDTWSHGIHTYSGPLTGRGEFQQPVLVESGPLRTTVRLAGTIATSAVRLYVSLTADHPAVFVRLVTNWREPLTILKTALGLPAPNTNRRDRVAGGWLERAADGREYPFHHATSLHQADGSRLGLVAPDSFALDVTSDTVGVTLVRNSVHALHNNRAKPLADITEIDDRVGTDEGPQEARLIITPLADAPYLERLLDSAHRPPWMWDDYAGMPRVPR